MKKYKVSGKKWKILKEPKGNSTTEEKNNQNIKKKKTLNRWPQ